MIWMYFHPQNGFRTLVTIIYIGKNYIYLVIEKSFGYSFEIWIPLQSDRRVQLNHISPQIQGDI